MKIVYGIMESHKNRELTKYSLETWLKDDNIYIFTDKECDDNRFIKICDRDDYHSNTIKCILGLRYMFEKNPESDFFVFMDNDTYMNFDNLKLFLSDKRIDELKAYGLILNHWPGDNSLYYLSGGAGFVLTNETMRLIYDYLEKNEIEFNNTMSEHLPTKYDFADVTLGHHLKNNDIILENSILFNSQSPEYYNLISESIKNQISFHYINTIDKIKKLINV